MIENILVCLEESQSTTRTTDVAIELARALPAALCGLAVVDEPDIRAGTAMGIGNTAYKHQRDESLMADAHTLAQRWLMTFASRCIAAEINARTLERHGRPGDTIIAEAARYDLIMFGRDANFRCETEEEDRQTRDTVLRSSPKPALVIPDGGALNGEVLVAWDDSPAAKRATLSFAQSGLASGRNVHVISIGDHGEAAWEQAQRGCALLGEHGISATVHNVVSMLSVAEAILERQAKIGAGLVVLGAYLQSRFSRMWWGSVTQDMLAKTTVPLYLHG